MAITDERTPRLNLPLPVKTNALKDDVERLRQSLSVLDTKAATLDENGQIPADQLPPVALTETYPVNSEAEMLALNAKPGSLAIRADVSKTLVLMALPASTLANWKEMLNDALVQLSEPDGYKNIGRVASFADLRNITPSYAGQRIILAAHSPVSEWAALAAPLGGGGEFVAKSGAATDDGGYICVPNGQTAFYWQRVIENETLKPEHYGAKCDSTRSVAGTDATYALNQMFATAIANNFAVEFPSQVGGIAATERGYFVSSAIIATGIHIIKGDVLLHFKSTSFNKANGAYAICLGDPNTDYNTIQNGLIGSSITVRDLDKRASAMGGIYIKYTAAFFDFLRAFDINGTGIEMAPVYDSSFKLISERCGNVSNYAIYTNGNGDECNAITFPSILIHDSYHKGLYITGSKHNIVNIHAEANAVLTTNDGYTGLTGATTRTGLGYVNHVIYLTGGHLGNATFNDYGNSDGKTYFDDQNTLNAANGSHVAIALVRSTCDNVINETASNSGGNIGRVSLFTGNSYSAVHKISAGHCYFEDTCRLTVENVTLDTLYSWSSFTTIRGGRISNWGSRVIANLSDLRIDATAMTDSQSYIDCIRCNFANGITQLSASLLNKFTDCTIPTINISAANTAEYGNFFNCDIGGTGGVTVSGGILGGVKELNLRGCTLRNVWSGATSYDAIRFIGSDNMPRQNFSIASWSLPKHTSPGTIIHQPKAVYTAGDAILSLCLTVNSDGSNTWKTLASA